MEETLFVIQYVSYIGSKIYEYILTLSILK